MTQNVRERLSAFGRGVFAALRSRFQIASSLPKRFSISLLMVSLIYFCVATMLSAELVKHVMHTHFIMWLTSCGPGQTCLFKMTVETAVTTGLLAPTLLLTFIFYLAIVGIVQAATWPRPTLGGLSIHGPSRRGATSEANCDDGNPLARYHKIGIILAGGGAKGAYQAGALKAIYEFVVKRGARDRVKMIAGTSIGAWNALFWLADLIESPDGGSGLLEQWWSQICVPGVIRPAFYFPFYRNFLLSDAPWRDTFEKIFGESNPEARKRLLHHVRHPRKGMTFYFTRSNVNEGRLDYATNRCDFDEDTKARTYPVTDFDGLREAVFCSMGIPPLFNYTEDKGVAYEDGGVVNNLPIRFGTELEGCDLLFVLPLNATFAVQSVNRRSLSKRLLRVMDIRQGVLERNALKMVKLYNQLARLRDETTKLTTKLRLQNGESETASPDMQVSDVPAEKATTGLHHALRRKNSLVRVFCICPKPKEPIINTMEFWNVGGACHAFGLMYEATKKQLEEAFQMRVNTNDDGVCMLQVDEKGRVDSTNRF